MSRRRARPALVAAAAALAVPTVAGCAAAPPCPPGQAVCGAASWVPQNGGAGVEGRMFVARALEIDGAQVRTTSEDLPVGHAPVVLRFDLSGISGGPVERAVLALAPHPSWQISRGPVHVTAQGVLYSFSDDPRSIGGPYLAAERPGEVTLSGRTRTPVRIDVTASVRAWQNGGATPGGLALSADASGVVFAGLGAIDPADRPRLEMVLR